jgi:hypothetical protein
LDSLRRAREPWNSGDGRQIEELEEWKHEEGTQAVRSGEEEMGICEVIEIL